VQGSVKATIVESATPSTPLNSAQTAIPQSRENLIASAKKGLQRRASVMDLTSLLAKELPLKRPNKPGDATQEINAAYYNSILPQFNKFITSITTLQQQQINDRLSNEIKELTNSAIKKQEPEIKLSFYTYLNKDPLKDEHIFPPKDCSYKELSKKEKIEILLKLMEAIELALADAGFVLPNIDKKTS
jgi:hypothetical protein